MRLNLREIACGVDRSHPSTLKSHPSTIKFNCEEFNYNVIYSFTWLYVCETNKK